MTLESVRRVSAGDDGFAGDYTGDGWPDFLSTNGGRLYVNPKGEPRRWDVHSSVLAGVSEICVMRDIDDDGKPDLVHVAQGSLRWSKPDPANPTGPWISTQISEPGTTRGHGIGAGDINGDKRIDILNAYGWWEQPPAGQTGPRGSTTRRRFRAGPAAAAKAAARWPSTT